jgi:hypothetical protein
MTLILANILISASRSRRFEEKGFANPSAEFVESPEVIENIQSIHENTGLIQGNITATNKKIEMMNDRLTTLEKVVMTLVEEKVSKVNRREIEQ